MPVPMALQAIPPSATEPVSSVQDATCEQGSAIASGSLIRLQHAATRKWLHSHHFGSPLSNNQEVSDMQAVSRLIKFCCRRAAIHVSDQPT